MFKQNGPPPLFPDESNIWLSGQRERFYAFAVFGVNALLTGAAWILLATDFFDVLIAFNANRWTIFAKLVVLVVSAIVYSLLSVIGFYFGIRAFSKSNAGKPRAWALAALVLNSLALSIVVLAVQ